jgi:glutathionylspermidine synthase
MQRVATNARPGWVDKVESVGLIYHHSPVGAYWDETAYYKFTAKEVDMLEAATNELQRICLEAGQHIIDHKRYAEMGIPREVVPLIEKTWNEEPPAIYGRFDLAYDGTNPPKLLEYNADTPTTLLEASVAQWYWLQDIAPKADQFNSIHERLVAKWKELKAYLTGSPLYFTHVADQQGEDLMTATYMRQTAEEAGLTASSIQIQDIGWDRDQACFVDMESKPITSIFKLYPWEWLVHEQFGPKLVASYDRMQWIEPIWKMMWSNKAILAILWELFPHHPNLLAAYRDSPRGLPNYVMKPLLSREGGNIFVHAPAGDVQTTGDYGEEGFVYQDLAPIPVIDGKRPTLGSWVIDGESAGMGIREASGPVTDNTSTFVPHLFE